MPRLTVGDKIIINDCFVETDPSYFDGLDTDIIDEEGTIIAENLYDFLIEFNSDIGGHSGTKHARGKPGCCWWVPKECVDLCLSVRQLNIKQKIEQNCKKIYETNGANREH